MPRAERRAQLLNTARDIIRTSGIGALTMSALAELSGASKPVVYEHFENSESVAIALLEDEFDSSASFAVKRLGKAETIYEYLDIVVDSMFEYRARHAPLVRSITNGFSSRSEVNAFYLGQQQKALAVYQDLLRQQGLSEADSHLVAYALMEMIGAVVGEFDGYTNPANRDTLKRLVNGLLHSVLPDRGARPLVPDVLKDSLAKGEQSSRRAATAARKA